MKNQPSEGYKNPAAVALGSMTSEKKKKSSAENGKKGGYPKGRPRKPKEGPTS